MGAVIMFILVMNLFLEVACFMISNPMYGLGMPSPNIPHPALGELNYTYNMELGATEQFKEVILLLMAWILSSRALV